ncbi:MAG: hypothetical protein AABX02_02160 [archaeon]
MKPRDPIKMAAVIDTFFVTFLFFLAGCLFGIFTFSSGGFVSFPLMIACGVMVGIAGGAYNYYFWIENGRGAFRQLY